MKSEIRISKFETNTNDQNSYVKNQPSGTPTDVDYILNIWTLKV